MLIEKELATKIAKINFMKGLIRIAKADGSVEENEKIFFEQAAAAIGLEEDTIQEVMMCWSEDGEIEVTFDTSREKMFFFVQAIQLCWIDNEYSNIEREEIRKLSSMWGVSEDAISKVEKWVQEGIEWNTRGDKLLELS